MYHVSIIVPLFNEVEVLPALFERLDAVIGEATVGIEVVMVDDGSTDGTSEVLLAKAMTDYRYQVVVLSRNFGHQPALTAGLMQARGTEAVMIIDGDLQDPPELFEDFYAWYKQGYDVVYGIRRRRKESLAKRISYYLYYRLQRSMALTHSPADSGDFCLISRRVVDILNAMPEESRYLRGLRSWVGFRQKGVEYERLVRAAGASKYTWRKLMRLAYSGIFNFSNIPLRFITWTGVIAVLISLGYLGHTLYKKYVLQSTPEGFTGLLFTLILLGGVQLISIGILGEYVSRIFFQVKDRPLFIVERQVVDGQTTRSTSDVKKVISSSGS